MAQEQLGIRLTLDGASTVTGGLSQLASKIGDLDTATAKVGDAFKSLGVAAVAALGVGSVAAITTMVKGYIDAAEGLKDLGIKTGATVESLSAFERIGKLTGTTAETIGQAMNRLAKNMAGSTEESKGAAQALKALGLDFATFSAMRPEDKMVTLARAMNQFEDGSAKSAAAMALMGKSGADLLPFMRDLGNAGELVATVTTEQAEAADLFNDSMTIAAERTEEVKRALALGLLPTLITLHELSQTVGNAVRQYMAGGASTAAGEFDMMRLAIRGVGTHLEALIVLASDVAFVFKGMGREIGGIIAQFSALGEGGGIFSAEGRAAWSRVGEMIRDDAVKARQELDKFQASVLGSTDRVLQARDAMKDNTLSAAENRNELERLGKMHGVTGQKVLDFKAATNESKQAVDQAAKAGQDYLTQLNEQLAALNTQITLGRELTKAEQERIKLEEDVRVGKKKLTDQELESARAKLEEVDALRAQVEQLKAAEKATLAAAVAREKELQGVIQATDKLRDEIAAQEAANLTAQTGIDYTGKLTIAKLRDAAATADRNALLAMERQENEELAEQYRKQAEGLRRLADEKEEGVHIQAAKEAAVEWKKVTDSINDGLTDALMRAFESGKGFFDAFKSTLVNAFKSLVLQPTIRAILAPVGSAVGSLFGVSNAAAGTGAAAGGPGLGSLLSSGMDLLRGGLGNTMGLNIVNSTLGQALGLSSVQNIGGNMIAGPTGLGSLVGSGLGMLGNGFMGYGISKALSGGYSAGGAVNTIAGIASMIPGIGPIAGVVGALVNRAFGMRAKEMKDAGITGTITGGDVTGNQFQDWFQKGGWFRSNRSGTDLTAMNSDLAAALDLGASGVLSQVQAYAAALQLPGEALKSVSSTFRVTLTGQADADQKAIATILSDYQAALSDRFASALAPLMKAGESATDALKRLAGLQTFTESINAFGGVFSRIAGSSIAAREHLIELAGGIDQLMAKAGAFVRDFYTSSEQAGLQARSVSEALTAIGLDGGALSSRADFRRLVEGLDVSTEQGRTQLNALLDLAPQFAQLADYLQQQQITLEQAVAAAPQIAALEALRGEAEDQAAGIESVNVAIEAGNSILAQIRDGIAALQAAMAAGNAIAASTDRTLAGLSSDASLAGAGTSYTYDIGGNPFASAGP